MGCAAAMVCAFCGAIEAAFAGDFRRDALRQFFADRSICPISSAVSDWPQHVNESGSKLPEPFASMMRFGNSARNFFPIAIIRPLVMAMSPYIPGVAGGRR